MGSVLRSSQLLPNQGAIPDLDEVQGRYRVRFARTLGDRDACFRLRFEVFNLELEEGLARSFHTGRDEDGFDDQCQHLYVADTRSGDVVGTYRLQVSGAAESGCGFYAAGEFDLGSLPAAVLAHSVEAGRACVAQAHRNRKVLFLLWRGLVAYMRWNEKQAFFGCSSLTSQSPDEGMRAYRQLESDGYIHPSLRVFPQPGFECDRDAAPREPEDVAVKIPKLFTLYLRYGARVLGPPAIDREFGTIDFLTYIDTDELDPKLLATITE